MIAYPRQKAIHILEALHALFGAPTLSEEERAFARGLLVKLALLLSEPTPAADGVVDLTRAARARGSR